MQKTKEHGLGAEQAFFDHEAESLDESELLIPPDQVERYRHARPAPLNSPKDALFHRLLPLDGKRVLDYGCGHGENACLLAACGARVCAFDLSPASILRANQRAEAHGLADRIRFDVFAAGRADYPRAGFDVITGFAILHHLHHSLPAIYAEIDRLLAPHGIACFIEPVANSAMLRVLRRLTPLSADATPDERQLRYAEIQQIQNYGFRSVRFQHFYCGERLHRLLGEWSRPALRWADHHAQRLFPFLRPLYGTVLVIAER
ncbi:MAG: Methyltransferase type 11 [Phycisphaerales bacterium]|jgi:SAM-dependent methyltransferase|nr:Methyltransferase type 11 [Phycisphaerales bacterium]